MYAKQTAVLTDCFDLLASVPFLQSDKEQSELAQSIIDSLGSYPKPQKKHETTETAPQCLGAYLYASTARNAVKLAGLGYIPYKDAFQVAEQCFENALSLLTNKA